jgi:hypothetical protein
MRKDQLVRALLRAGGRSPAPARRSATPRRARRSSSSAGKPRTNGKAHPVAKSKPRDRRVVKRIEAARSKRHRSKDLADGARNGFVKDRLIAMVRDPFWLHAYWELTRRGVQRAEAALGQEWHTARPVLRLLAISSGGSTGNTERVVRDIEIHGGVNNWYIDVSDPPHSYRVDIGYRAASGRMFVLARSNVVTTPRAGASDALDENWADVAQNFEKIYAMTAGHDGQALTGDVRDVFEERLRRPMGAPVMSRLGATQNGRRRDFKFEMDAEMIVYGSTEPGSRVTLQGEPVKLRSDGTFTVRYSLPNCRQVIPAVAASSDGAEQRTIILAVERNTKSMEPVSRDTSD